MTGWNPPTYYRLANPPLTFSFCLPSMGCLVDENGSSTDEGNASKNGDIAFSNEELGGNLGGDFQPQDTPSEGTQAGQAGTGTSNKNPAGGDTGLKFTDTVTNDYYEFFKHDRPGPGMDRVTQHFAGESTRPYIQSPATNWLVRTITEDTPIADKYLPNGLKWVVPGFYGNSEGTWELVLDTNTNTIVHFLFNSSP